MMMSKTRDRSGLRYAMYLAIVGLLLPLALLTTLEVGTRLYIHYKYGVPGKSYGLWRYDAELGAQHRESAYNTNAQTNNYGFRGMEDVLDPKPAGSIRVITYGGSTTFGYNVRDEETWSARLEQLLRSEHQATDQVLNGGAILWSIGHVYARAKKDIPLLRPDYVVIYSGINEQVNADVLRAAGTPLEDLLILDQYGQFAKNLDQNRWSKRNLALVRLIDYAIAPNIRRWRADQQVAELTLPKAITKGPDATILKNYLHVLQELIALVHGYDGKVVFVVQANNRQVTRNDYLVSYSRTGAQTALAIGATVVDAQRMVDSYSGSPEELFSESGVHYSELGSRLLAKYIYESVFGRDSMSELSRSGRRPQ